MNIGIIGWLHTLASAYALYIGAVVLWRMKGGTLHRSAGRRYLYASVFANLSALAIYRMGGFNIFHVLAIATLLSLAVAFVTAYRRSPRTGWLRIHLTAIIFSYYQLVGGLINELFVRLPVLKESRALLGISQSAAMLVFLLILAYFWGRTAGVKFSFAHTSHTSHTSESI